MLRSLAATVLLAAVAAPASAETVYFTADSGDTLRRGAAGNILSTLPTGNPADVDLVGYNLYYTDFTTDTLYKVSDSGGSPTAFLDVEAALNVNPSVFSLAVNSTGSTAFFGESLTKGIYTMATSGVGTPTKIVDLNTVTGYNPHSVSTFLPRAGAIAGGKVYWTDTGTDVTATANLDGSGATVILANRTLNSGSNNAFNALAVDSVGGKLYLIDNTTDAIYVSNLDGTSAALFVDLNDSISGTLNPEDMEYFDGTLYVADTTQGLYTIDIGTKIVSTYFGTDLDIRGVAVPEPASLGLLALAGLPLLARRRWRA